MPGTGPGQDKILRADTPSYCPDCKALMNTYGGVDHDADPEPGDVSVCAYCACLMVFNQDMTLRAATDEEQQKMMEVEVIQRAIQSVLAKGTRQ